MYKLVEFIKDENGLELVEYALILALITVSIYFLVTALGTSVGSKFSEANSKVSQ